MKWKKINSKIIYKNKWLSLREDMVLRPDGKTGIYSLLERTHGNTIIALSKNNTIFLIKEFRYPVNKYILQLPAGTTDNRESDLSAAKKELFQETGIKAKKWKKLGNFYIGPGHENIQANVFLATELDIKNLSHGNHSSDELILNVKEFSIIELKKIIAEGKIECGITLAALNIFFQKLKK